MNAENNLNLQRVPLPAPTLWPGLLATGLGIKVSENGVERSGPDERSKHSSNQNRMTGEHRKEGAKTEVSTAQLTAFHIELLLVAPSRRAQSQFV